MIPGFSALFNRSNYAGPRRQAGLSEDEKNRIQRQSERFAGAMIGFGLEHDSEFRRHFLETICGLDDMATRSKWEVLIEPKHWGDLVLSRKEKAQLVVVELKIDAGLKDEQNPETSAFYGAGGYGKYIEGYGSLRKVAQTRYVTVQNEAKWQEPRQPGGTIVCYAREWRELLRRPNDKETNLETLIYDCLAGFGVWAFYGRRLKNMKLASSATKVMTLLAKVLESRDVGFKQKYIDAGPGYIGLNLDREKFPKLAKLAKSGAKYIGWFGYEENDPGERLSFWFYSPKSSKQIKDLLEKVKIQPKGIQEDIPTAVGVYCLADKSKGDLEWFQSVFKAVENAI